jgi:hypothetical protein
MSTSFDVEFLLVAIELVAIQEKNNYSVIQMSVWKGRR